MNKDLSTIKDKFKNDVTSIKKDHKAAKKKLKRDLGLQVKENINLCKMMDKEDNNIDSRYSSSEISAVEGINIEVVSTTDTSVITSANLNTICETGVSNALCQHSPQCVLRQPFPPPLPSVTHIQDEGSEYHIHITSKTGVPGRYGGHISCMGISSNELLFM